MSSVDVYELVGEDLDLDGADGGGDVWGRLAS